ncbi:hypothetical protein CYFUS_004323 [Cystobacter fuscus]|uniref:Uncharacterized protein n=1 Tax=Cystobacter fuscus TaxID=43 RepID=A0A250J6U1_9BACT|nr:RHS repeat-associated core domain-containing protein [Cystobacter fuscus]ATB38886.1 hypothetical protein CYFUS_004323 [Cystobacter fuscus]
MAARDGNAAASERPNSGVATQDTLPPVLVLRVPGPGPEVVTHSPYVLRGSVGDDSSQVRVSVQGFEVPVLAGGFLATVPLTAGDNAVVVRAWDEAGNQTQRTHVLRVASLPPQVTILSPLSGSESPGPQATVRVRATSATSAIRKVWVSEREAIQKQPGEYETIYALRLGDNTIEVRAVDEAGLSSSASVRIHYRSASQEPLSVTGVSPSRGATGVEPDSLISVSFNKPVKWESLKDHLIVRTGGERVAGGYSLAPGGQTAMFVAARPLPEQARLTVSVDGVLPAEGPGLAAGFSSDFTVRGALTRVRGSVTDAELQPLAGVEVTLEGRNLSTRTEPNGNWALFVPAGGEVVVRYDGGVGKEGQGFPTVRRRLFIAQGAETVDAPLRLTPTDKASAQWVRVTDNTDLTFAGRQPGLRVSRAGGALSFAGGKTADFVTATWLPSHLLPVPREGHVALGGVWQMGPAGLRLDTPVTLSLPNLTPGLPDGRYALVLAYDPHRHLLARVGFGRVQNKGTTIVTEAPLPLESLEFLAYSPLSQEQHDAVARALGTEGGRMDGGTPTDGGLGWLRRVPHSPGQPWWKLPLSPVLVGEAHAQTRANPFQPGLSALDSLSTNEVPGRIEGTVRSPMDQEIVFSLLLPEPSRLNMTLRWDKPPFTMPVAFKVSHIQRTVDATLDRKVRAQLEVHDPGGVRQMPPTGEDWDVDGDGEALVTTQLTFQAGTTKLKMMGSSPAGLRVLEVLATLEWDSEGPGATLLLERAPGSTEREGEAQSPIRFKDLRVTVTGPAGGGAGVTGERGTYGIVVPVLGGGETGISCTEVPLASKLVERVGEDGTPRYDAVMQQFGVCSEIYSVTPGGSTTGNILVDARFLKGALRFVDRKGAPLETWCGEDTEAPSQPDLSHPGEYLSISPKDIKGTEVHFFREDDLEHPIANYSTAEPDTRRCTASPSSTDAHGEFTRLRLGPTHGTKRYVRERCLEIQARGDAQTQEDKDYFAVNCENNRTNFMSLGAGDRVVVFAINHATGYSGMKTVTVPAINQTKTDPCKEDENQPPLTVEENGRSYELSRCTERQLTIPVGIIDMFPPEIDLRVSRKMEAQGSRKQKLESLIRQGGSATTNDDLVAVSTQWRVRVKPYTPEEGTESTDGGTGGLTPASCDGGPCPNALVDQGDAGLPLEVYCSELPPTASSSARQGCINQDPPLLDVPAGVPPLAGRLIKVTGAALEQPMVKLFPVKSGGRFTQSVQLPEYYRTSSDEDKPLNALPRANYYLHVVGHSFSDHDANGDGFIQESEKNQAPPNFSAEEAPVEGAEAGRIPTHAVGLKNVYRHIEPDGNKLERFDLAREHAFRVIEVADSQIIVLGRDQGEDSDLTSQPSPSATQNDTAYDFLLHLLEPDGELRGGVMPGEYVVRLGGDGFGIDCPFSAQPNDETLVLSGSCGGDFLPEVLASDDLLYFELYLSGNAENILYRFNFEGLASRTDFLSAGHEYTLAQAEAAPELQGGQPAPGREISQAPMANFSLKESEFTEGLLTLTARRPGASDVELKQVPIRLDGLEWKLLAQQDANDLVPLSYDPEPASGVWNFHMPLPSAVAAMQGGTQNTQLSIWVKVEALKPRVLTREYKLGNPLGTFTGVNAAARAQQTVAGVNVADGHLSFTHTDFSVPNGARTIGFSRTYNNQNNLLSPMGLGWSHNYDGWVLEEKYQHRYVVVLGGQAYPFPGCVAADLEGMPERVKCFADTSHNNVLFVNAPLSGLSATNAPSAPARIEMRTAQGQLFLFTQPAQREEKPGRRKWLLNAFGELREDPGDGPVVEIGNRAELSYKEGSDLIDEVNWNPGNTKLKFEYEGIDTENAPTRVRVFARSRGFKWLSRVQLLHKPSANRVLYQVDFEREPNGNLLHALRTQWDWGASSNGTASPKGPFPLWTYSYHSIPSGLVGEERWNASNELYRAWLIHGATPGEMDATSSVQWWAEYTRVSGSSAAGRYEHLKPYELVAKVSMTGQQDQPFSLEYQTPTSRLVTRPDGVATHLSVNPYGSVNQTSLPIPGTSSSTTYQNDDSLTGQVMVHTTTSAMGVQTTVVPKSPAGNFGGLRPEKIQYTGFLAGSGVSPVFGSGTTPEVSFAYDNSVKPGVPTQTTLPTGLGPVSWTTTPDPQGHPQQMSASGVGDTKTLLAGALYDVRGRPEYVDKDEQGRSVTYQYNDEAGLGQLETLTLSLPADQVAASALATLHRMFSYDAYGRLIGIKDVETGAEESWTYDGLGRVVRHIRRGEPDEDWTYEYLEEDRTLTIRESLARYRAQRDPSPPHVRTSVITDGLLTRESYTVGAAPVFSPFFSLPTEPSFSTVSRTYGYVNGRLETTKDERGIPRKYVYDANGRLERVEVGLAGDVEVSYTFDNDGRVTSITNHLQRTTTIGHDELGRAVSWDYGDKDVEGVELDVQGTPMRTWWGESRTLRTEVTRLDAFGRPVETRSKGKPGGVLGTETRDSAGRLTKRVDGVLGLEDEYEYRDVLGRLTLHRRKVKTRSDFPLSDKILVSEETRAYDDMAHTVSIERVIDTGIARSPTRTESETLTLDTAGRVRQVKRMLDGIGLSVDEYRYNERGQVRWHQSEGSAGPITEYWHDPMGNLVQRREPADVAPGEPFKITYLLERDGRPRLTVGPHPGYGEEYEYDDFGELSSKTLHAYEGTPEARWTYALTGQPGEIKETGPEGTETLRRFNARGRLVSERVSGGGGSRLTTFDLDGPWEARRLTQEGSWKATWQTLERDDLGRPLDQVESWSAGGLGYSYQTKTTWTGRNATIAYSWTTGASTPPSSDTQRHRTMEISLDSLGNVVRSKAASLSYTDTAVYDASGLLSIQQPAGRPATLFTYDQGLLRETDYAGELTKYVYDLSGRLTRRTDPDDRTQAYEYYPRGVVKTETYGRLAGSEWMPGVQHTAYDYDPASGFLEYVRPGAGTADEARWRYQYGARGELRFVSADAPLESVFEYTYDALTRLKSVIFHGDSVMPRQEFSYDFANRLSERKRVGRDASTASWLTTYVDGAARTLPFPANSGTDSVNEMVHLLDGRGRVARTTYAGTTRGRAVQDLFQVDYEYNGADQPLRIVELRANDVRVNNVFEYDSRGLMTSLARDSDVLRYEYTASGQRASVYRGTSSTPSLGYTYDEFDRLSGLIPASTARQPTMVRWEPGGTRLQTVGDDVVMQERCYDNAGRLSVVMNAAGGSTTGGVPNCGSPFNNALMSYLYTYDGRGNRLTEESRGSKIVSPGLTRYGYDGADRLTGVHYPDGSAVFYSLNSEGTRLGEKKVASYGVGGPLDADAYWRFSDSDPNLISNRVYKYDTYGGIEAIRDAVSNTDLLTFKTDRFGQVQYQINPSTDTSDIYEWDPAGRLARVTRSTLVMSPLPSSTDEVYRYTYDYAGLRRQATSNNSENPGGYWLYAGEELVAETEYRSSPRLPGTGTYIWGMYERVGDLVTAYRDDRILTDGLGSAVGRMNATTATAYQYDAWGAYTKDSPTPAGGKSGLGYTGHLWDKGANLVYAQQRWYSPETGRFLSQDPVGAEAYLETPMGMQPWLYANNNPLRYTDPDGRCVNFFSNDVVSSANCVESAKTFGGYAVGVGKVVGSLGILTYNVSYNVTGGITYAVFGGEQYRDQYDATRSGVALIDAIAQNPSQIPGIFVKGFVAGLDQMNEALERGDSYSAGEGVGDFVAQTVMLLQSGSSMRLQAKRIPAFTAIGTNQMLKSGGIAITVTGPKLPPLVLAATNALNESEGNNQREKTDGKAPERSNAEQAPAPQQTNVPLVARVDVSSQFRVTREKKGGVSLVYGDPEFHGIEAAVDRDGVFGFNIRSSSNKDVHKASGVDMLLGAMVRLKSEGVVIKKIRGFWITKSDSVNAAEYWENRYAHRLGEKQSALETWTGRMAQKLGYPRVDGVNEGSEQVVVIFGKAE